MPRKPTPNPERLSTLEKRLEAIQRQIRREKSAAKGQARADDTRRKIIAGALALEHFAKNPGSDFGKIMFRLIDEYARPEDRVLFDFLPVRDIPTPAPELSEETQAAE